MNKHFHYRGTAGIAVNKQGYILPIAEFDEEYHLLVAGAWRPFKSVISWTNDSVVCDLPVHWSHLTTSSK